MEFITDFISNQATLLIGLVVVLAFIIKLLIARLSKDTTTAIATNEIVDNLADTAISEIEKLKAKREKENLENLAIKEGFVIIDKPKRKVGRPKKATAIREDGNIINSKGEVIGTHKTAYKPDTYQDIIERES